VGNPDAERYRINIYFLEASTNDDGRENTGA
jgi:hypothetical protein